MTTKQKSKELVDKFLNAPINNCNDCQVPYCDIPCTRLTIEQAKQCALICVDEIWAALESERVFEQYDYWTQVKTEIQKQ